jgi:flagellar P-ring protein precursor FlgI
MKTMPVNFRGGVFLALYLLLSAVDLPVFAQEVRIKDLGRLSFHRENALVGYGLVTGLAGTGDSARNKATRQSLANVLSRFDVMVGSDDIQSRNVAVVMVTANLPSFSRAGDSLDAVVTSVGDARSLAGGTLLLAPLKGPDGRVYALAQGPLTVGGYRYDANGNQMQKNHPTVGLISNGARVEVGLAQPGQAAPEQVTFVLHEPDYTTAGRISEAINRKFGEGVAEVHDASALDLNVPAALQSAVPRFLREIESLSVQPDRHARVIVNERTGTVVSGGDVRISSVAVSHGDLKVTVESETSVSQPGGFYSINPGARTAVVTNSRLAVSEGAGSTYLAPGATTVADLVQSLARLKVSTRDVIAILQAIKAAGALHAELVIQ